MFLMFKHNGLTVTQTGPYLNVRCGKMYTVN